MPKLTLEIGAWDFFWLSGGCLIEIFITIYILQNMVSYK